MDPETTLTRIEDALFLRDQGDDSAMDDVKADLETLADWLYKGGFEPINATQRLALVAMRLAP